MILTSEEVSALVGLSKTRVNQLVRQGKLPAPAIRAENGRRYYDPAQVARIHEIMRSGVAEDGAPIKFNRRQARPVVALAIVAGMDPKNFPKMVQPFADGFVEGAVGS